MSEIETEIEVSEVSEYQKLENAKAAERNARLQALTVQIQALLHDLTSVDAPEVRSESSFKSAKLQLAALELLLTSTVAILTQAADGLMTSGDPRFQEIIAGLQGLIDDGIAQKRHYPKEELIRAKDRTKGLSELVRMSLPLLDTCREMAKASHGVNGIGITTDEFKQLVAKMS